jgi:hypothetical protein
MFLLVALGLAGTANAKRIIYVADNIEASWAGAKYEKEAVGTDVFKKEEGGDTLADAINALADWDVLIIIAHGEAGTIEIDGKCYAGFKKVGTQGGGTGVCRDVLEIPEITKTAVKVVIKSCFSSMYPNTGGDQITVVESLATAVSGASSFVVGSLFEVDVSAEIDFDGGGSGAEEAAADAALVAEAEANGHNTGTDSEKVSALMGTLDKDGLEALQDVIDAAPGTGPVTIVLAYNLEQVGGEFAPARFTASSVTCSDCSAEICAPATPASGLLARFVLVGLLIALSSLFGLRRLSRRGA